jgi:hypothetical protein
VLPASAHHAFSADYETGSEGTIVEVIYRNPHARYYLEVTNSSGTTETRDLQTMNRIALGRSGWKRVTLEHFYPDAEGFLHGDMWLHDPKDYTRPPYLLRTYARVLAQSVISKFDCAPCSFFRVLALDGQLEEFRRRGDRPR